KLRASLRLAMPYPVSAAPPSLCWCLRAFSRPSSFRLSFHSPCWDVARTFVARTFSLFERGKRGGDYLAAPAIRVLPSLTTWLWSTDPVAAPSSNREWRKSFSPAAAPRRPSVSPARDRSENRD